jgi:hypothetical protein
MRSTFTLLLLFCAIPCLAAEPGAFRFLKEVQRQDVKENILAVTLDSDIYGDTRDGLPDFRIYDGKDQETPYLLEKVSESCTQTVHETSASEVLSLHEQDNAIEVIVRMDRDTPPADGLTLHTPLLNYERRLRVFGSDDGKDWSPLVSNGLVFDYSRFMDVRNNEVRLPKNHYRRLKVVIDAITDSSESPFMELTRKVKDGAEKERTERSILERRPLRIDRLELWHEAQREVGRQDKTTEYPTTEFRTEEAPKEKATLVYVKTMRQPLTELTLATTSHNFDRAVVVEKCVTHGVRSEWVTVARHQIRRIDFRGFHSEGLTIAFPEHREAEYRIVIHNEDNPPLAITGVKARGNVYRAVFLAAAGEPYRLYYGSEQVEQPKYDAAAVLLPLRQGNDAVAATLGSAVDNTGAGHDGQTLRRLLNHPLTFGSLAVLLAVLLGWALFHAARRISQLPKEPEA